MALTIPQLIAALPEERDETVPTSRVAQDDVGVSWIPAPVGRLRRLTSLGTLQAKIAAGYLFHWLRGWFRSADEQQRKLAEVHWRSALRTLDSMGYLRGAVMKVGQTLANFPDIAPQAFVETLERLHYDAPPMHWSLLKEMVHNELGDDPENLFASFDKRAFAAASLGQVHRAQLKSGDDVAIKIQYPGIARTIDSDFKNLFLLMLPARLTKDWENVKDQCDDLYHRLQHETDYVREAKNIELSRSLFRDEDGIVVPRVYPQFSTARILTMERLQGVHLDEFIARNPSQRERNEIAKKIVQAWYRLLYAGRMLYADFHPGNFLVLEDGRLGVLDFGFVMNLNDDQWEMFRKLDRPLTTGDRAERMAAIKEMNRISDHETDQLRVSDEFCEWSWLARSIGRETDFGDEADFRRGVDLFTELFRKRYTRGRPESPTLCRSQFGWRALLYQLKAKFDFRPLAEEEVRATGWDRSDYAP